MDREDPDSYHSLCFLRERRGTGKTKENKEGAVKIREKKPAGSNTLRKS